MKSNIYRIISGILFPIVFVALFFVIGGTEHGVTCWIGFGSTMIAYIMLVAVPLLIPNSQSAYLFGMTSGTITGIFFAAQFVLGLIFMISDFEKWKIALVIEIILFVITLFFMLQLLQTDESTAKKEIKHQQEVYSVKNLVIKSKMIVDRATDSDIKKCVRNVYDELNSCPTSSNPQVKAIDSSISYSLDVLNQSVMSGDLNNVKASASSVIALIKERKSLSR